MIGGVGTTDGAEVGPPVGLSDETIGSGLTMGFETEPSVLSIVNENSLDGTPSALPVSKSTTTSSMRSS